jgi:hypothetical protein
MVVDFDKAKEQPLPYELPDDGFPATLQPALGKPLLNAERD